MSDAQLPAPKRKRTKEETKRDRQKKRQKAAAAAAKAAGKASKLFETTEVLENIFSNLSVTDLTRIEPVNHQFKDVIRTSIRLRKQRFLKAAPVTSLLTWIPEYDATKRTNVLKLHQPRLTSDPLATSHVSPWQQPERAKVITTVHPVLRQTSWVQLDDNGHYIIVFEIHRRHMEVWTRGPWEAMYVTQPPCKNSDISIEVDGHFKIKETAQESRATLGDLRDRMKRITDFMAEDRNDWQFRFEITGHVADTGSWAQAAKRFEAAHPTITGAFIGNEAGLDG